MLDTDYSEQDCVEALQKQKRISIQQALERRILHGLACEWQSALYILSAPYRALMKPPIFSLRDMKRTWGYWSREKNEICLNRTLVLDYPWDTVREILQHEMAHQMAAHVFGSFHEPPHGPSFLKACSLLRANPKASGTYQTLYERIFCDTSDPVDRMTIRVRKLLALAESPNRFEADAAMLKAHELMATHHIEERSRDNRRDFVSVFMGKPALRHPRDAYHLSRLIQDFYFIHGIWIPAYVINKGKMGSVLEISGMLHHVKIAHYVYEFIAHFIDSRWDAYNREKGLRRNRKTDFAVGIIEGFRNKLVFEKKRQNHTEEMLALIETEDPQLSGYIHHKYPHTVKFRGKTTRQDEKIRQDGMREGRNLIIFRGITERKSAQGLLPESKAG